MSKIIAALAFLGLFVSLVILAMANTAKEQPRQASAFPPESLSEPRPQAASH